MLDRRALNRATLARQLLLRRQPLAPGAAIAHLVGLQAQEPQEPFVGLWSRLAGFRPRDVDALLVNRRAVRTHLMRRTMHLVTAADCLTLRPLHQPMLTARVTAALGRRLAGVDVAELGSAAEPLLAAAPRPLPEVARLVGHRWPGTAARDLADALSSALALVQVPPRGLWRQAGPARATTVRAWLGREPAAADPDAALEGLVLRYLRAFGPAASADLRAWCGLSGLPAVVARLRPRLRLCTDERGRELLDVPDGPLPDPGTPAPARFLPAFDNVILGFADRTRIVADAHRGLSVAGARFVLLDGFVAATWTPVAHNDGCTAVSVQPLRPLTAAEHDEVAEEGGRLAAFLGDGRPGTVTVQRPG